MAAEALEQSMLESKDKEQLLAIAQALGIKTTSRAAKATLIDKILETTGGGSSTGAAAPPSANGRATKPSKEAEAAVSAADATTDGDTDAGSGTPMPKSGDAPITEVTTDSTEPVDAEVILGPDGEPLADWEIELIRSGEVAVTELAVSPASSSAATTSPTSGGEGDDGEADGDAESRNSRRRRRRRNKGGRVEGPQGGDQERFERPDRPDRIDDAGPPINMEPVQVSRLPRSA